MANEQPTQPTPKMGDDRTDETLETRLEEALSDLANTRTYLALAEERRRKAQVERDEAVEALLELVESRSWRLTRPLRWLTEHFRGE